jgi:hypothetical protein
MVVVAEWQGVTTTQDVPDVVTWTGAGSESLSITTVTANDLVITTAMTGDVAREVNVTPDAVLQKDAPIASRSCVVTWAVKASPGTYTSNHTSVSGNGSMIMIALKAAGGGTVQGRKVRSN